MCTTLDIPQVSNSSYFGKINKVIWFAVTEDYGYFDVTLKILRNQLYDTNISINNVGSAGSSLWSEIFIKSSNPTPEIRELKILNVPGLATKVYGVFNNVQ